MREACGLVSLAAADVNRSGHRKRGLIGAHEGESLGTSVHGDGECFRITVEAAHQDAVVRLVLFQPISFLFRFVKQAVFQHAVKLNDAPELKLPADQALNRWRWWGRRFLLLPVAGRQEGVAALQGLCVEGGDATK